MGMGDRIENAAEKAKGKIKEGVGGATDDHSMESEGKMDQTKADVKNAGEDVKDAFKDATDRDRNP